MIGAKASAQPAVNAPESRSPPICRRHCRTGDSMGEKVIQTPFLKGAVIHPLCFFRIINKLLKCHNR